MNLFEPLGLRSLRRIFGLASRMISKCIAVSGLVAESLVDSKDLRKRKEVAEQTAARKQCIV